MLSYLTAGESHGKGLLALVNRFPAGVTIDTESINAQLRRRQGGYGRGGRQKIETDEVEVLTGILHGRSMGSPIALWVKNRDYKIESMPELTSPRPGHGDLTGSMKYQSGIRPILERSSARETAARVAAGALASLLLEALQIETVGYVTAVGGIDLRCDEAETLPGETLRKQRDSSELYSLQPEKDDRAKKLIDQVQEEGDTLGGVIEVRVTGLPFGLGTHAQWNEKIDGRLAQAVMAVQAIKGVEIGLGFETAARRGSQVHDPIAFDPKEQKTRSRGFVRPTNFAGGVEAGMTNTQPLIIRAAMKPIATLRRALPSVDLKTKSPIEAGYERSDVCAVSATSVVLEAVVAFEIAVALTEKFGSDSLEEIRNRIDLFERQYHEFQAKEATER